MSGVRTLAACDACGRERTDPDEILCARCGDYRDKLRKIRGESEAREQRPISERASTQPEKH